MLVDDIKISFRWNQVLHINFLGGFLCITVQKHDHLSSFDTFLGLEVKEHVFASFSYFQVFLLNTTRFEHTDFGSCNLIHALHVVRVLTHIITVESLLKIGIEYVESRGPIFGKFSVVVGLYLELSILIS